MGELIDFAEVRRARIRRSIRRSERESIRAAIDLMQRNLAEVAAWLRDAPAGERDELLTRVERLVAMIRYGTLMLGEGAVRETHPA